MNKKTTYLFEMHCCVNSPGQKSSFPSQYTFIFAGPLLPNRFLSCEPPLFLNLLTADCPADYCEYLRKAKLSERGTKCRAKENGKGRNRYHVTSLMWTATAGDGSEISNGPLDLSLNSPKPLPVLRSHAAIPRFTSFPSPAVAVHVARRRFIENHISVHENTAFPQPL